MSESRAKPDACPHCKVGRLARAKKKHVDTSKTEVDVYACNACEYTEGRPVKI